MGYGLWVNLIQRAPPHLDGNLGVAAAHIAVGPFGKANFETSFFSTFASWLALLSSHTHTLLQVHGLKSGGA
jgi:hypothetical protein